MGLRFFTILLLLFLPLLSPSFAQVLVKGMIFHAVSETVMVEYEDPISGNVHFFETELEEGKFQYEFNVTSPITIIIHIRNQSISIYALPKEITQFDCDESDIYGTLNIEGKTKEESKYLNTINELNAFEDKFKNHSTQSLSSREQQLFDNALQLIGTPGSEQSEAFIATYTAMAKETLRDDYSQKTVCEPFRIQYLDTTFLHLSEKNFPAAAFFNNPGAAYKTLNYDWLINDFKEMKINHTLYRSNEAYREYVGRLFLQEIDTGHIAFQPQNILPYNVDSFKKSEDADVNSLVLLLSQMMDTGEVMLTQEDPNIVLARYKKYLADYHQHLKKLFDDEELRYHLLLRKVLHHADFGGAEFNQAIQYVVNQYPKGSQNEDILEQTKLYPFLTKGNLAPALKLKKNSKIIYDFAETKKAKLLTFGASWSLQSLKEWVTLQQIIARFDPDKIDFIFVKTTSYFEPFPAPFFSEMPSNMHVFECTPAWLELYNASPLPRFYIIDKNGAILTVNAHYPTFEKALEKELKLAIDKGCVDCE